MLDTNLKETHKRKYLIIAMIVLIPALILVSLYPQMEKAMLDKKQQWIKVWEEEKEQYEKIQDEQTQPLDAPAQEASERRYYLQDEFINYAVEASYYQYAMLLQEATGKESFIEVLDTHGWINDYYELKSNTPYYAEYTLTDPSGETVQKYEMSENLSFSEGELERLFAGEQLEDPRKSQLAGSGYLGYLVLKYDSYGKLKNIRLDVEKSVTFAKDIYPRAKASIDQYENNANYYVQSEIEDTPQNLQLAMGVCPKDFQVIYLIYQGNERFVTDHTYEETPENYYFAAEPHYSLQELYFATGAYWIAAGLAIAVFLAAMILPFFKKLGTGWEKLFSMPMEITLCAAAAGLALAYGMCMLMSVTTMTEIEMYMDAGYVAELLGHQFGANECYQVLLAVNFLGWALAFFVEYICAAHLRQFFSRPKYYLKNRVLCVMLVLLIHKKILKLVNEVLDIDIHEKMHKSILKLVIANFVIITILSCLWFAGVIGGLIYSAVLYILLKKYGSKLQKQYQNILNAAGQMAEGNLYITLEEDLGILAPLGEELKGVQQGFAKAVAEEAKSQNMKSELITNVSHDLKTPLTAIITYVDLLKNPDITEEERKSYIETLDLKSQRLKVLIEDLFEVSKANSGNVTMNFMEVDVVKLIKEVRVELSDKMEASNLEFRWNLPEEKLILKLDGQRTYRIFENILNNAIKYALPFTRVYVELTDTEKEVIITFKNISAQELSFDAEHLTDRFVRGDSSRNSEGSGLGLAIAKSFTELQNGKFEIRTDGDLFKVSIKFQKN